MDPGSHHGWEGGPHRGLTVQVDQGGRAEEEDPGAVPGGARPAEAFLQGQAGKPALQAAHPPSSFVLVSSRHCSLAATAYILSPLVPSRFMFSTENSCLSQEQRLNSQIDTPGRQLAL